MSNHAAELDVHLERCQGIRTEAGKFELSSPAIGQQKLNCIVHSACAQGRNITQSSLTSEQGSTFSTRSGRSSIRSQKLVTEVPV